MPVLLPQGRSIVEPWIVRANSLKAGEKGKKSFYLVDAVHDLVLP
jgi:hypothetical protein